MSHVLVAYASKHGSTREIAEVIGESLRETGLEVDVRAAAEVDDLGPYDAVVLGSALYSAHCRRRSRRSSGRPRRAGRSSRRTGSRSGGSKTPRGNSPGAASGTVRRERWVCSARGARRRRWSRIEGMSCGHCVMRVEKGVAGMTGVKSAKVDLAKKEGTFVFDPGVVTVDAIKAKIVDIGYKA